MSQDNKPTSDRIQGENVVSRAYRQLQQQEPSSDIDHAILEAAHKEAGRLRKSGGLNPFSGHWFVPVSLAAVLVITVGIVITLEKEPGTELYEADQYRPQTTETKPDRSSKRNAETQKVVPRAGTQGFVEPPRHADKPAVVQSAPAPAVEKMQMDSMPAPVTEQQPAANVLKQEVKPVPVQKAVQPPVTEELKKESVPVVPKTGTIQPPAEANPATAPAPEPGTIKQKMQDAQPAAGATAAEAAKPVRDPETWLKEIRELIQQDKATEAREQLNEFVRTYPDYPLDDELSALAQ